MVKIKKSIKNKYSKKNHTKRGGGFSLANIISNRSPEKVSRDSEIEIINTMEHSAEAISKARIKIHELNNGYKDAIQRLEEQQIEMKKLQEVVELGFREAARLRAMVHEDNEKIIMLQSLYDKCTKENEYLKKELQKNYSESDESEDKVTEHQVVPISQWLGFQMPLEKKTRQNKD